MGKQQPLLAKTVHVEHLEDDVNFPLCAKNKL
jgi:hypothetical protein